MKLKIAAFSDTHLCAHDYVISQLKKAELLLIAGDFCNSGNFSDIILANNFFREIESKNLFDKIIIVAGNHDIFLETAPKGAQEMLLKNLKTAVYLEHQEYIYKDFKIFGSPYSPTFFNWAFMKDRGKDIKRYWDIIPSSTDILITHGPPYGILDTVPKGRYSDKNLNVGCEELVKKVFEIKPKLHVFGHIHLGRNKHKKKKIKNIQFSNVAIVNNNYKPVNKVQYFEIEK